jgi:hypothetical protein
MDWLPERLAQMREAALARASEPFVGVTTDGRPRPGLFPLQRSGVSTASLLRAAEAYLASLTPAQCAQASLPIDAPEWRTWSNVSPFVMRHGMLLEDLSPVQREAALALVAASLSASGYATTRDVMRLNHTLGELTGAWDEYGESVYWLSIFGRPSPHEPWGWQLDGHHCNLNYFVVGDQVVLAPAFLGSEPVYAESGRYAGTRVFAAEEAQGLALVRSLGPAQRAVAIPYGDELIDLPGGRFGSSDGHIRGGAQRDNLELPYEGITFGALDAAQRSRLLDLVAVYTGRLGAGHDRLKLDEVRAHLDETHFVWYGATEPDSVFYYRIHSPVILIEFDHQCGIVFDNDRPSRIHIHTVVRTPNGNDYGKDLLKQHYDRFHSPSRVPRPASPK